MKLATLNAPGRDGMLVVVSDDLRHCAAAADIAPTLQQALDDWAKIEPKLRALAVQVNAGNAPGQMAFDETKALAPLPRAYQWADGSAYVNHVELVRKSRGVEMPASFWTDPLMYQGGSDVMLAPHADIVLPDVAHGIDFEAEIAVVIDDVPMGVTPEAARAHIKLIMLVNDVSLRNLAMAELQKGFGFFQCKPPTAFSPVAVTPDALVAAWDGGKIHLPLVSHLNGALFGKPNAGVDMVFDFGALIAHAARTRKLSAGTIVGSGTVSNVDRSVGSSCIVEKRLIEKMESGDFKTPFMQFGDRVRIEMFDANGASIFGSIDQQVVQHKP
ncbi:MAG: fumarylacetoacetate hydrolase family protein [Rickettsiales bacterium]